LGKNCFGECEISKTVFLHAHPFVSGGKRKLIIDLVPKRILVLKGNIIVKKNHVANVPEHCI
jgi:hypothetical protein